MSIFRNIEDKACFEKPKGKIEKSGLGCGMEAPFRFCAVSWLVHYYILGKW